MPDKLPAYVDSDVFLSYVNDDPDRVPTIEAIFEDAHHSDLVLFTSELSIVEVAFAATEQQKQALSPESEERISALWLPGSPVRPVEYYRLIGDDARSLIRLAISKGWSLKPFDALHLATARRMEVSEFYTYEKRLPKFAAEVGFEIREPFTRRPRLPLG